MSSVTPPQSPSNLRKLTKDELVDMVLELQQEIRDLNEIVPSIKEYIIHLEEENTKHRVEFNRLLDLIKTAKTWRQIKLLQKLGRLNIKK